MSYFCDAAGRESREIAPGVFLRTFWGSQMTVALVDIEPRAVVPSHSHPAEQAGIVVAGTGLYTVAGEARSLRPGDSYVIPGGMAHSFVAGDEPVQLYEVFSPVREELKY